MAKRLYRPKSGPGADTISRTLDSPDPANQLGQEDKMSAAERNEFEKEEDRHRKIEICAEDASRFYGEANPAFKYRVDEPAGFQLPQEIKVEFTCDAEPGSPVNQAGYHIKPRLTGPAEELARFKKQYRVVEKHGTLRLKRAPITINVADATAVYGCPNPAFSATVSSNFDNLTAVASSSAGHHAPVGVCEITAVLKDPDNKQANYAVSSNKGKYTIVHATLTAIAGNVSRPYGSHNPPLPVSVSENPDGITASGVCTAKPDSPVGQYPVNIQLNDPLNRQSNYVIVKIPGLMQVTPLAATYYETGATSQINVFEQLGNEVAMAQPFFPATTYPVASSELDLIASIAANAPNIGPEDVQDNLRAIIIAFMKATASLPGAVAGQTGDLSGVCQAITQLYLSYAARAVGATYRKLNGAMTCALQVLSEIISELSDPYQAFPAAIGQISNYATAIQTALTSMRNLIPTLDALGCSSSEQDTIAKLQKAQSAVQQACCSFLCEFDIWHGLLQPATVIRLRPMVNQVAQHASQIGFAVSELKAESRDWRQEVALTAMALKQEVRKLTQTIESSQSRACGGSTKFLQDRIQKLDALAGQALEWPLEQLRLDRIQQWSDQAMGTVDQLLRCQTELPPGLSDGLFRYSGLAFQAGCQARKAAHGQAQGSTGSRSVEEFVLSFADSQPGSRLAVRVLSLDGKEVGRHEPDAHGTIRIPAKPGDEFDFIGIADGIPFETVRMKY